MGPRERGELARRRPDPLAELGGGPLGFGERDLVVARWAAQINLRNAKSPLGEEALLIGVSSGFVSAAATFAVVNYVLGGIKFPIAFFGAFYIPQAALGWGVAAGALTALVGSILPACSARSVRVSEVFAKVA